MKINGPLSRRLQRYQVLCEPPLCAIYRWHPGLVDAALDVEVDFTSIAALVADPAFLRELRRQFGAFPPAFLDSGAFPGMLVDPATDTLRPFYHSVIRRVAGFAWSFDGGILREEVADLVRFHHVRLVASFRPFGCVEAGREPRSFGFKAYLERRLPSIVRKETLRLMRGRVLMGGPEGEIAAEKLTAVPKTRIDPAILADAIGYAVRSEEDRRLFWGLVVEGRTFPALSRSLERRETSLRGSSARLIGRIAKALGAAERASDFDAIRKALGQLASPGDYARWVGGGESGGGANHFSPR